MESVCHLDVTDPVLAKVLRMSKGMVSKILKGSQRIQPQTSSLLIQLLKNEVEFPWSTVAILERMRDKEKVPVTVSKMNFSAVEISEWFVRRFVDLNDR